MLCVSFSRLLAESNRQPVHTIHQGYDDGKINGLRIAVVFEQRLELSVYVRACRD